MVSLLPPDLDSFPTKADILALVWIESKFNPHAVRGENKGLLQVRNGSMDPETNLGQGLDLLRSYHRLTGSAKGAVLSFNAGIGNYRKGRYSSRYWREFQKRRSYELAQEQLAGGGGSNNRSSHTSVPG